ncbi:MAG: hypothetical protein MRY64_01435 [Hyphomonadaceae bacterium]|nr:hypothetical protein [Hyphomonadaceae bacterium]
MTPVQRRNEIRKFCATFFSAIGIAGFVSSFFSPASTEPVAILARLFGFIGGMAFFLIGYYIMQRTEESDD